MTTKNHFPIRNSLGQGALGLAVLLVLFVIVSGLLAYMLTGSAPSATKSSNNNSSDSEDEFNFIDSVFALDSGPDFGDCMYATGSDRDTDDDGVADSCDNCPTSYNPDQEDSDHDGIGNVCDSSRRRNNGGSSSSNDQCDESTDCGIDGFINTPFCSDLSVLKDFVVYECVDADDSNSKCVSHTEPRVVQTCTVGCVSGSCTDSSCAVASDCGTDGFIGDTYCVSNNVTRDYVTYQCSSQSVCSFSTVPKTISVCSESCSQGACQEDVTCDSAGDCSDGNPLTYDECVSPGTSQSMCTHVPLECSSNSDCGNTGFVGLEFCQGDLVFKNYQTSLCVSPGTLNSRCEQTTAPQVINECSNACAGNGVCVVCNENSDCSDNDDSTHDSCVLPGTVLSYCQHTSTGECTPGTMRACGLTDVGLCSFGTEKCTAQGVWSTCDGAVFPTAELCDSRDNDCDGVSDETFENLGQQCTVSVGQCSKIGTYECSPGGELLFCSLAAGLPISELCNGVDDDCDGIIDEENVCGPSCTDECILGVKECSGTGYHLCDNFDNDPCSEWSAVYYCPQGNVCQNNTCVSSSPSPPVPPSTCTNQCSSGMKICSGNGYQLCGDFNFDGCSEWGAITSCGTGQTCQGGTCTSPQPSACTSQCQAGMRQCSGTGYKLCADYNGDGCYEWSQATSCGYGKTCQSSGFCV
jgi:hypothetical protein